MIERKVNIGVNSSNFQLLCRLKKRKKRKCFLIHTHTNNCNQTFISTTVHHVQRQPQNKQSNSLDVTILCNMKLGQIYYSLSVKGTKAILQKIFNYPNHKYHIALTTKVHQQFFLVKRSPTWQSLGKQPQQDATIIIIIIMYRTIMQCNFANGSH